MRFLLLRGFAAEMRRLEQVRRWDEQENEEQEADACLGSGGDADIQTKRDSLFNGVEEQEDPFLDLIATVEEKVSGCSILDFEDVKVMWSKVSDEGVGIRD